MYKSNRTGVYCFFDLYFKYSVLHFYIHTFKHFVINKFQDSCECPAVSPALPPPPITSQQMFFQLGNQNHSCGKSYQLGKEILNDKPGNEVENQLIFVSSCHMSKQFSCRLHILGFVFQFTNYANVAESSQDTCLTIVVINGTICPYDFITNLTIIHYYY